MNKWLFFILILTTPLLEAKDIEVRLKGAALVTAPLYAELVDASQSEWSPAVQQIEVNIAQNHPVFSFFDVPEGIYAIRIFLDLDSNGELNRSRRGIPLEPIGYSLCGIERKSEPQPFNCGFIHSQEETSLDINLIHLKR